MAHKEQLDFVKVASEYLNKDYSKCKILEIGSYDVNGSIRKYFLNSTYVGVDLTTGPGVDIVCEGNKLDHPEQSYDITLSCECFEHNPYWAETFTNMYRMTNGGGVVIFTCATTGRPEHGTARTSPSVSPGTQSVGWDYYRNLTADDFEGDFKLGNMFESYFFLVNKTTCDLYFFGKKNGEHDIFDINFEEIQANCTKLQVDALNQKKREKYVPKILRPFFRRFIAKSK